jgi:hypothetical protein
VHTFLENHPCHFGLGSFGISLSKYFIIIMIIYFWWEASLIGLHIHKADTLSAIPLVHFAVVILEMGSPKLFPWTS